VIPYKSVIPGDTSISPSRGDKVLNQWSQTDSNKDMTHLRIIWERSDKIGCHPPLLNSGEVASSDLFLRSCSSVPMTQISIPILWVLRFTNTFLFLSFMFQRDSWLNSVRRWTLPSDFKLEITVVLRMRFFVTVTCSFFSHFQYKDTLFLKYLIWLLYLSLPLPDTTLALDSIIFYLQ
jgi:hypothetical protein